MNGWKGYVLYHCQFERNEMLYTIDEMRESEFSTHGLLRMNDEFKCSFEYMCWMKEAHPLTANTFD